MPMAKRKRKLEHILLFWCLVGTRLFIRIFAGVVAVALFMNALHIVKLNERKMFTYFWTLLLHWFLECRRVAVVAHSIIAFRVVPANLNMVINRVKRTAG